MRTTQLSAVFHRLMARFAITLLLCGGVFCTSRSHAAVLSWSGGGGLNANWDSDANWGFVGTPANGDTLIFPASQPNLLNTNNIVGLTLNQIRFVGPGGSYDIRGIGFTITNNIQATNTLGAPNSIANAITLGVSNVTVNVGTGARLILSGALGGSAGITKTGAGTLTFSGANANNYTGTTIVAAGALLLNKSIPDGAIPGDLVISNSASVQELRNSQIYNYSTVTLGNSAVLNFSTDTNVLSGITHSNVANGDWTLGYSFTPSVGMTVTHVRHYFGTKVSLWTEGGILLATNKVTSVPGTWVETALATPVSLSAGFHYRVGVYTGGVSSNYYWRTDLGSNFNNITIDQSYQVAGDAFPNSSDPIRWWLVDFRYNAASGDAVGSLNGGGNVTLGGAFINSAGSGNHTYDGVVSGTGSFLVYGTGTGISCTLNGNNTYTGPTFINDGLSNVVRINGSQPKSAVYVGDLATLTGSGTVGNITNNGTLAPGPGTLSCSNVIINPSPSLFRVNLTGPAGTDYDQLNVRGTCFITNAGLSIAMAFTKPVAVGQQFVIINNDGVESIKGIFLGNGGGTTWTQNGYTVVISYVGGDGNDMVLTLTNIPGAATGTVVTSGNGDGVIAPNECNYFSVAITNRTGTPMTGITATLASQTPGVIVTESSVPYPNIAGNDKGTNTVPFQLSTTPNFICGSNISLTLTVTSATHGAFTMPVTVPTGVPLVAPVRFDFTGPVNVVDVSTNETTNVVSVWNGGPLSKIAVSVWLSSSIDSNISLTLIAPNGTPIDLSSGNGGSGFGYGTGSADGNRTTFDDGAATVITAGSAPFVGSFRPEVALNNLLSTTPVTGNWRLRIADAGASGLPDTLRNWSLFLYGTDCGIGSGLCELCPNVTISSGFFGPPSVTNYYTLANGTNSVCGVPKPCPGTDGGNYPAENFLFRNGPSDACITVTVTNISVGDMAAGAYSEGFDPQSTNRCAFYLGNPDDYFGAGQSETFSFSVASNAVFTVTALGTGVGAYKVTVSGGDCRPVLNVTDVGAGNAKFDWTTAAGGYQLESTNVLGSGSSVWPGITNIPTVNNSRYEVTNTVPAPNQFYQLRKPLP